MKHFVVVAIVCLLAVVWASTSEEETGDEAAAYRAGGNRGCNMRCDSQQYRPVCACRSQGCRTFYSQCHFNSWNECRRQPNYTWKYRGRCRNNRNAETEVKQ